VPFTIHPYHRFPVQYPVTHNTGPFLKLPLTYFLAFGSLITLLLLSSGPAYAEWVRVSGTDDGLIAYVDLNTIRREGHFVTVWVLYDYKTSRTVGKALMLSSKAQHEYDCAEKRSRVLALGDYDSRMGMGKVINSDLRHSEWAPVEPWTINQRMWTFACGKQ
jgi:hypothetical protein